MKEKLIELFTKVSVETDTFAPFVTYDQFEDLADEIVKLWKQKYTKQRRNFLNS